MTRTTSRLLILEKVSVGNFLISKPRKSDMRWRVKPMKKRVVKYTMRLSVASWLFFRKWIAILFSNVVARRIAGRVAFFAYGDPVRRSNPYLVRRLFSPWSRYVALKALYSTNGARSDM